MSLYPICVDFDGVIHDGQGWGADIPGEPMPGVREGLRALGGAVVVFTARTDHVAVQRWLRHHSLDRYVRQITNIKPCACIYIDDRAYRFDGDWRTTVADVLELTR